MPEASERSDPTRERLIDAALELVAERGFRGATTRAVAERAGVAEVTLFRLFKSKPLLIAEAVARAARSLQQAAGAPSGDLRQDLLRVAGVYWALVSSSRGAVVRLLPELTHNPVLRSVARPLQRRAFDSLVALFRFYQEAGELQDEPPDRQLVAFLGPLMARTLLREAFDIEAGFDAEAHVRHFLEGRLAAGRREGRS